MAKPSTDRTWVAETHFSGVIAELRLPRASVARLLPPELCLEPRVARARTAPVLMAFGTHTASAVHLAALRVRTGVTFNEVFFGVRCQIEASRTPVLFVPLMYCDEPVSTWVGNALYGFNKQPAVMEWLGETFLVAVGADHWAFRTSSEVRTERRSHRGSLRRRAGSLRFPLLGRRPDRTHVLSKAEWAWPPEPRRVAVVAEIPPGLSGGAGGERSAATATLVHGLRWRMGWPGVCHSVAPDLMLRHTV